MKTFLKENFFKFMIGLSALIVSIAILMYIISITKSPSSLNERVTGDPIRIGRLEVAEFNFPKMMDWYEAKKACANLGSGWRLPTIEELNLMYLNKDKIGGFANSGYNSGYWSSAEYSNGDAWLQYFDRGFQDFNGKNYNGNVRAVRSF